MTACMVWATQTAIVLTSILDNFGYTVDLTESKTENYQTTQPWNENVLNSFFPKGNFIKSFSMHTCSQHAHRSTHTHWTGLGEKTVIWFSLFLLRRVKFSKQPFRLRKESHGSLSFTYPQWAFLLLSCHTHPLTHSHNFMEYYFAHALAILQILYSLTHTWIHTCHTWCWHH